VKRALVALISLLPCTVWANGLQPLSARDVPALLTPPAHGERIIALWALDCAYCEGNLAALMKLQRAHPRDIELITVATDSIEQRDTLAMHLRMAKVEDYPARAYAEAEPERLNFLIDPSWGGETPRVLVIRANGERVGISGELTAAELQRIE
jgi:hypothetical protein